MDITWAGWTPDQEEHGDFGIGNLHNVEDGQCGVISTPTTMEEHGPGLIASHIPTVEPFEY